MNLRYLLLLCAFLESEEAYALEVREAQEASEALREASEETGEYEEVYDPAELDELTQLFSTAHRPAFQLLSEEPLQLSDHQMFQFAGRPCHSDSDCGSNVFFTCQKRKKRPQTKAKRSCLHKRIFPLHTTEVKGTCVLMVLMTLAVISGIGGGGIIVSLLMEFYKLKTKEAMAVSGFATLIGAIVRYLLVAKKKHPSGKGALIDYSVTNLMLPTVMMGSILGVFLNIMLSSAMLQILLTLVLAGLAIQAGIKAKRMVDQENFPKAPPLALPEGESSAPEEERLLGTSEGTDPDPETSQPEGNSTWGKQALNFTVLLSMVCLNGFRGSPSHPSYFGVTPCSKLDWAGLFVFALICCSLASYSISSQRKEQLALKGGGEEKPLYGTKLVTLQTCSLLGGVVSGALGLGGGCVFNPLLMSMGYPSEVSSATGMYMIIFSTGASTLTYYLNDLLILQYGLWVGVFCAAGCFIGMYFMEVLMHYTNRQSPRVIFLCLILALSTISVPFFGLKQMREGDPRENFRFHSMCG